MGGRAKAKGRGGGRGGGGGGRGRGRSAHGSGGRFGWGGGGGGGGGGRGSSSHRGDGLYGAEDAGDFVALKGAAPGTFFPGYGGGPKRKHRQMHQAYAHAEGGGRRVRKPDLSYEKKKIDTRWPLVLGKESHDASPRTRRVEYFWCDTDIWC